MNIKRAKEEIKNTIEAYLLKNTHGEYEIPAMRQRPVLLMGPPGIGKTQIMEQVARECRVGLVAYTITHHTRQSAIGLPFIQKRRYAGDEREVTEYTMSEIVASVYSKMEETGLTEGILFIDEINCVSETLAPAMLQFLQYKTFGNHKIPEGWIIVAAGNPPEYNKSVREFDIATLDRIKRIDVEANFQVWKEYARQVNIHPAVISYLAAKPQYFYQIETTVDGKIFATPRGWEDLSRFLEVYEKIGKTMDRDVVSQYIQHARIAKDFANYLELFYRYQARYQIDQVLSGKRDEILMEQASRAAFDERLSVISLILAKLDTEFRKAGKQEDFTALLFGELKELKARLFGDEENPEPPESAATAATEAPSAREIFTSLTEEFHEFHMKKKKSGLLTREQDYCYQDVSEALNLYLQTVKTESIQDGEEIFGRVKELFGEERARYEQLSKEAGQMLEYAFDFMEGTFGDSQEMVIFITELNTSIHAVRFLQENECSRYYQYNRRLLFEDREADIKSRLDRLGEFG